MIYSDLFKDVTKFAKKLPTSDYQENGKHPIIDQGQKQIAGYTDIEEGLFSDVPVIIFGDHTRVIKYIDTPFFIGADGVKVIKCLDKQANYNYLYYLLSSVRIPNTGYNRHYKWLKEARLVEHTKEEQEKIVAVLSTIDNILDLYSVQLNKLDELIKSRFVEMFGDPVHNRMNWNTKPLAEMCKVIVDCPHSTPNYTSSNTGYMCIRTSIVKKNRIMWDKIEYISKDEYYQRIQRKKPEKGDIIYTREGAILGIAAIIDRDCSVALGQRSMLLSPDRSLCTPEFLSVAMNFETFLNQALNGISGSASPHINVGDVKLFQMIQPPINKQQEYSTFVTRIEQQKATIQQSIDKLETLKKSLMQKYFG